jgi:sRNA-binding carbon storage regulator CsrA
MPDDTQPGGLSLSRYAGESIVCILPDGREIRITLGRIECPLADRHGHNQHKARIIVRAPKDVRVFREELLRDTKGELPK